MSILLQLHKMPVDPGGKESPPGTDVLKSLSWSAGRWKFCSHSFLTPGPCWRLPDEVWNPDSMWSLQLGENLWWHMWEGKPQRLLTSPRSRRAPFLLISAEYWQGRDYENAGVRGVFVRKRFGGSGTGGGHLLHIQVLDFYLNTWQEGNRRTLTMHSWSLDPGSDSFHTAASITANVK